MSQHGWKPARLLFVEQKTEWEQELEAWAWQHKMLDHAEQQDAQIQSEVPEVEQLDL